MISGFSPSEEQKLIRDTAAFFAKQQVAPGAAARDKEGRFPVELLAPLADMGFLGIKVPAADGGAGADTTS